MPEPYVGPKMGASRPSPALWVQLTQAMVARELVEEFGLAEREAAARLGVGASAVSQYLSGKRLAAPLRRFAQVETARRIARRTAQTLTSDAGPGDQLPVLLAAAAEIARTFEGDGAEGAPVAARPGPSAEGPDPRKWVRARVQGEQVAVAECMRLAQRSRDELTRALFRQIASDSLRHAEIVASLGAYLERGVTRTIASGISRADVDRLIERERAAEASEGPGPEVGGVMELLWQSMEADERKHELLLERLRGALGPEPGRPGRRRRSGAPA